MFKQEKKYIIGGVILIVLALGSYFWASRDQSGNANDAQVEQADIIYYYGRDCIFCKEVQKFLDENRIDKKVAFVKKEVQINKKNLAEMLEKAKECYPEPGKPGSIGTPFVYSEGRCYIGAPDVIDFFKKEAGI